jgi:hypothetical protein
MSTTTKLFLDSDGLSTLWSKIHNVFTTKNGSGATGTWNIDISGTANKANTANKLSNTASIGSYTNPVYFTEEGIPAQCIYNIPVIKINSVLSSTAQLTTEQFINLLKTENAFSTGFGIFRLKWDTTSNQVINDTNCGNIVLAGSTIEVIGTEEDYTIRIQTSYKDNNSTSNIDANIFIYFKNGTNTKWFRIMNSNNILNLPKLDINNGNFSVNINDDSKISMNSSEINIISTNNIVLGSATNIYLDTADSLYLWGKYIYIGSGASDEGTDNIFVETKDGNGSISFNVKEIIPHYNSSNDNYYTNLGNDLKYWKDIITYELHAKNNIYADGTVYVKNGSVSTSDERYKNYIEDIAIDFDKLKKIPKKRFTWKKGEFYDNDKVYLGTSAQVVKDIYPELVYVYKDTTFNSKSEEHLPSQDINLETNILGVDYEKLSLVALAAIDKLNEQIEILKSDIELLKKENSSISDKLIIERNNRIKLEEKLIDIEYLINKSIHHANK